MTKEMLAALENLEAFFERRGESYLDRFERIGDWFRRETGYLRPGKDCVIHAPEVRQAAFEKWLNDKVEQARAVIGKARAA